MLRSGSWSQLPRKSAANGQAQASLLAIALKHLVALVHLVEADHFSATFRPLFVPSQFVMRNSNLEAPYNTLQMKNIR